MIGAFGNFLVKNGPVSKEVGLLLNRAHEIRLVADYNGDSVDLSVAQEMVEQAVTFVDAMRANFIPEDVAARDHDIQGMEP